MRRITIGLIALTVLIYTQYATAQENCRVLNINISESYTGKCKNGLAHGQGTATGIDRYEGQFKKGLPDGKGKYTWSTGEVYDGQWRAGKREGIGKYTFLNNGLDTINDGQWVNDRYIGPVYNKPSFKYKEGVDRYSFQKNGTQKNRVLINLYQNGGRNSTISNLLISSSSGYETSLGQAFGFDAVTFPVNIKVMYTSMNKLHTSTIYVRFEFEISEPGDWTLDVHN
ncbi:MAG: hypothetical protein H6541_07535 [Lentimicrobiaceae bacterium]|nr:hypothetical protein [Lentimicrobiaceae bacterium]